MAAAANQFVPGELRTASANGAESQSRVHASSPQQTGRDGRGSTPTPPAIGYGGYPIAAVHSAKRLRAAGESYNQIADYIGETYGTRPHWSTVQNWTTARQAQKRSANSLRRHREKSARGGDNGARLGTARHTKEFRVARMRALSQQGLDFTVIATVMSFDYRETYSAPDIASLIDGMPRRGPRGVQWRDRAETMIRAAPDLSSAEVARRIGVSHTSVQKFRKELAA